MIVAIDYDLTYTRDPACFDALIETLKTFGHRPVIVTCRYPEDTGQIYSGKISGPKCPIYYTSGAPKDWYMMAMAHVIVDVWVDDDPRTIYESR